VNGADAALVLDCRGMRCPLPIIELARHIGDVEVGALVTVLADDPAAASDVPAWCRMRGHEYVGAAEADAYTVRRLH
jgi:tRNA 2-thiouridine synthesizing protein A